VCSSAHVLLFSTIYLAVAMRYRPKATPNRPKIKSKVLISIAFTAIGRFSQWQ
jgi:hypothetical protein